MRGLNGYKFKGCLLSVELKFNSSHKPFSGHSNISRTVPALPLRGALLKDTTSDAKLGSIASTITQEENVLQMSNVAAADMVAQILSHAPLYVSPFNSPRLQDARGQPPRLNLMPIGESAYDVSSEPPAEGHVERAAAENTVLWETASDAQSSISDSFASTLDTEDSRFVDTQQRNWMRGGAESSSPAVLWTPGANDPLAGSSSAQYSGNVPLNNTSGGSIPAAVPAATTVADITALALTINNAAASNKMYDGNTVASLSGTLNAVILNDVSNYVIQYIIECTL